MSSSLTSIGSSTSNGSLSSTLAVSGLASGMDWQKVVQELAAAERAPEIQWKTEQSSINAQNSAFSMINTYLTTLQTDVTSLKDPTFYDARVANSSDSAVADASASAGSNTGNYTFNISQLATAAQINGATGVSQGIAPGGDTSSVTIGTAGFSTPITEGTFTVNGAQVTVAATDSLQQVFDNIASATNNAVTASYDATTDKITLTSATAGTPIVLGSAADTSNFLQVTQLYNNDSDTVASASALGHPKLALAMTNADGSDNAGLSTAVTDGGSGAGAFTINGVSIHYNAGTDAIQDVLNRINSSKAGVMASYDPLNNRFSLTNKTTGDVGIAMQDVSGNFLAATGLSAGTLEHGKNLLYTLNNNPQQLVSQTNNISAASSGIQGLTVSVQGTGSTTISVQTDTDTIGKTIKKLVTDYGSVQSYIGGQMTVSTGSGNSVVAGTLTGDQNANDIASSLRSLMSVVSSLTNSSGTIKQLADLGFQSNGQNKGINLTDAGALDDALTNHLSDVKALFTDATNGIATKLNSYLDATIGDNGTLVSHQASLTRRSNDINTQISNLENKITQDSNLWTSEFQAMEQAQSQINKQLSYLSQAVSGGSL